MDQEKVVIGFIGAGSIARSHVYALNSLRYYYDDAPDIELSRVCSAREVSRKSFMKKYEFHESSDLEEFTKDNNINTVFILGPNKVHYDHLLAVMEMPAVNRIYLEKPVCSGEDEARAIEKIADSHPNVSIQVGFQYLFSPAIREAIVFWRSGILGRPIHFELKYYHSDYLKKVYRDRRQSRLTPAPDGGAMADLGSHAISIMIAFLGKNIVINGGLQGGHFDDVDPGSDLFSLITLFDPDSGAVGTLASSRISSGTGDMMSFDFYCENGSLRYSSVRPDYFEYYLEETGLWSRREVGSNFSAITSFPSGHVSPGWLRSMVHAHYVFLTGNDSNCFIPDIKHGLAVQKLVTQTADHMSEFRDKKL